MLTRPGQALDLAATVTIAERGTSAAAASNEDADAWDEEPKQRGHEQAAPQYNAQQVRRISHKAAAAELVVHRANNGISVAYAPVQDIPFDE